MQLGGAPLCAKCSRPAYHAEQALGPGRKIYHRPCLTCHSCNRRLDPGSLVEHDGEAYCSRCHGLQFGTRDLRSANAYSERTAPKPGNPVTPSKAESSSPKVMAPPSTDEPTTQASGSGGNAHVSSIDDMVATSSSQEADHLPTSINSLDDAAAAASFSPFRVTARDASSSNSNVVAGPRPLPVPPPKPATSSTRPLSNANQFQGVPASALSPAAPPPPLRSSSTIDAVRGSPAASKLAAGGGGGGGAEKCANDNCTQGGRVYFAEGVNALGRRWHRACLRCTRCRATVDPGKVSDRDGQPYCKACYGKEFGPVGLLGKR